MGEREPLRPEQATIGVITALPEEYAAVRTVFDYESEASAPGNSSAGCTYAMARVGKHIVAAVLLEDTGNNVAAIRATHLKSHCPRVRDIIMTGIAGAVPWPEKPDHHVRLGDIVVCGRGGVTKYDFKKETSSRPGEVMVEPRHAPRPPSSAILGAARRLEAGMKIDVCPWDDVIELNTRKLGPKWKRPPQSEDKLQDWHDGDPAEHPRDPNRRGRMNKPRVFMGPIASADMLLKNPTKRNELRDKFGVKAVEMEASGIADATWYESIGYFVVRGTCDYCNSDKGDRWHNYASLVAAAYTKVLIEALPEPAEDVELAIKTGLQPDPHNITLGPQYPAAAASVEISRCSIDSIPGNVGALPTEGVVGVTEELGERLNSDLASAVVQAPSATERELADQRALRFIDEISRLLADFEHTLAFAAADKAQNWLDRHERLLSSPVASELLVVLADIEILKVKPVGDKMVEDRYLTNARSYLSRARRHND